MKIYTRTGDEGETALLGGQRVRKDHARIATYGTLDELNATLGVARAEIARSPALTGNAGERIDAILNDVQNHLFDLGAELATPGEGGGRTQLLAQAHVDDLEAAIDQSEAGLAPLSQFILPGGGAVAAQLHLARCVCRRAEREMVSLAETEPVRDLPLRYVNRLSDLLFVLARLANHASGLPDTPWTKPASD